MSRNLLTMIYDAIIAGLGAMGSAAAFHLARRGARVLGLDRYRPPHALGSSHGRSRIIRQAYFEHPQYVPLVQQAYACWSELERLSGRALFDRTGGLMIGNPDSDVVSGSLRSAREHRLDHETLTNSELRTRYPMFHGSDDTMAVWEPHAGFLRPEACVSAHLALAADHGAMLSYDEPVLSWTSATDGVTVVTTQGRYTAQKLVVAAGAWTPELTAGLVPLTIERQVQHWFVPQQFAEQFDARRFPVFIWEHTPGSTWYGIPSDPIIADPGVKLAVHHAGTAAAYPELLSREVTVADTEVIRALVRELLPDAEGPISESTVCLYTNTPDEDFVIGTPAAHPDVLVVSACSGHGFKFSSAIGKAVAAQLLGEELELDLTPFSIARFQ